MLTFLSSFGDMEALRWAKLHFFCFHSFVSKMPGRVLTQPGGSNSPKPYEQVMVSNALVQRANRMNRP